MHDLQVHGGLGAGDATSLCTDITDVAGSVLNNDDADDDCYSNQYQNWYGDADGDGLGSGDATVLCTDIASYGLDVIGARYENCLEYEYQNGFYHDRFELGCSNMAVDGMTFDELNEKYLMIGRNRRKDDGAQETPNGRKIIGKIL